MLFHSCLFLFAGAIAFSMPGFCREFRQKPSAAALRGGFRFSSMPRFVTAHVLPSGLETSGGRTSAPLPPSIPAPRLPQRCQQVESPTSFCSWMSASSSPAPAQTGPASGCRHPPMPSNEGTPPFRRQNAAPTPKDEDGVRILQTGNIPRPRIIPSAATDGKAARPKDRTRALRPQIGEAFTL